MWFSTCQTTYLRQGEAMRVENWPVRIAAWVHMYSIRLIYGPASAGVVGGGRRWFVACS
jgi:hypothetical protein